ncbi:unnamed protein product, partial [Polarella glacialis]
MASQQYCEGPDFWKVKFDKPREEAAELSFLDRLKLAAIASEAEKGEFWTSRAGLPLLETRSQEASSSSSVSVSGSSVAGCNWPETEELKDILSDEECLHICTLLEATGGFCEGRRVATCPKAIRRND